MYTLPVCLVLAGLLVSVALTSDDYYKPRKDDYRHPRKDGHDEPRKDDYRHPRKDGHDEPKKDDYNHPRKDGHDEPRKDDYRHPRKDGHDEPKKYDDYDQNKDDYYKPKKCEGRLPASFVERSFKTCQRPNEDEYGEYYVETEPSTYAFDPDCPNYFLQKAPWSEYDGKVEYVYVYMPTAPGTVFDVEECSQVAVYVKHQYPVKKPAY